MDAMTFIILAAIGLLAGILGGMIGLGGGLIIIPALVLFLGLNQKMAQGTSVAIMLPPIGIFAVYNYYKAGYVNIKFAIVIALTFMVGGWLGSKIALSMPDDIIKKVFALIMILVAIKMIFSK